MHSLLCLLDIQMQCVSVSYFGIWYALVGYACKHEFRRNALRRFEIPACAPRLTSITRRRALFPSRIATTSFACSYHNITNHSHRSPRSSSSLVAKRFSASKVASSDWTRARFRSTPVSGPSLITGRATAKSQTTCDFPLQSSGGTPSLSLWKSRQLASSRWMWARSRFTFVSGPGSVFVLRRYGLDSSTRDSPQRSPGGTPSSSDS